MSKNLLFTSAGDNTLFHKLWVSNEQNYDIAVIYYGKSAVKFKKYTNKVKYCERRQGSKFQNFYYFYHKYPEVIKAYDRFFIVDDDIIINVSDINKMFELSEIHNFSICQPSFKPESKISHKITIHVPKSSFRYTNFIEVNVPIFTTNALHNLMKHYDPKLIGWGIDYLYIWANGISEKQSYAIVDEVNCINPYDCNKRVFKRELSNIKNWRQRGKIWEKYANEIGCPPYFTQCVHSQH